MQREFTTRDLESMRGDELRAVRVGDLEIGVSGSLSGFTEPEEEVKFVEGRSLLGDCPACYRPYGKYIANLDGCQCLLFMFVVSMAPLVVRFTLHSTYLNFAESMPSLKSLAMHKFSFYFAFISGVMISLSEYFDVVQAIVEYCKRKRQTNSTGSNAPKQRHYKNCLVIYETKGGFPLWKTKNNLLAADRPTSLRKWLTCSTALELFLHVVYNTRWVISCSFIYLLIFTNALVTIIASRSVNNSNLYLLTVHVLNGLGFALFFAFALRLCKTFFLVEANEVVFKLDGKVEDARELTARGKRLIRSPLFAFLTDRCPCNYAVPKNSTFPRDYRYSIRYHCILTHAYKYAFFGASLLYGLILIGISIYSIFTKMTIKPSVCQTITLIH